MYLNAIDPGTTQSAMVSMLPDGTVLRAETLPNEDLLLKLRHGSRHYLVRRGTDISSVLNARPGEIVEVDEIDNICHGRHVDSHLAIEVFQKMGMDVGQSVFDTAIWVGRFIEAWYRHENNTYNLHTEVFRMEEKMALCEHPRAKDKDIRAALIDLYGGSKEAAVGRKASPGPLYGIKAHEWSALAVGVTYLLRKDPLWRPAKVGRAA